MCAGGPVVILLRAETCDATRWLRLWKATTREGS